MNPLYVSMIGALVRAGLLALGVSEASAADETTKIVGGALALGSIAWSLYQKHRAHTDLKEAQKF